MQKLSEIKLLNNDHRGEMSKNHDHILAFICSLVVIRIAHRFKPEESTFYTFSRPNIQHMEDS